MPTILPKKERTKLLQSIKKIIEAPASDSPGNLLHVVRSLLKRKKAFQNIVARHGTPCYVIDGDELDKNIASFSNAFSLHIPESKFFYALKTNPHPFILKKVVAAGFGLDVASATELHLGLSIGAKKFIFSGPGKTNEQLRFALRHSAKTIINIDSVGELDRLGVLAAHHTKPVRCGVRIHIQSHGDWQKFGIHLHDLAAFWKRAKRYRHLSLEGIQFHTSLNEDAHPYIDMSRRIAQYLKKNFSKSDLHHISFIDMGGGFYPSKTDGYYPWATPAGEIASIVLSQDNKQPEFIRPYYRIDAIPIASYAREIGSAIKKYLSPLCDCSYYFEPGRIISSTAMHILLRVVDSKSPTCAILDGGNNMLGWERLSYDYFPVINLTHPGTTEHACMLYGSLCLSGKYDTWGHYYYGTKLVPGDTLVVPYQGHLTYALAQNFIHPIPPVYILK